MRWEEDGHIILLCLKGYELLELYKLLETIKLNA